MTSAALDCPECWATIRHVRADGTPRACPGCGESYAPTGGAAAPPLSGERPLQLPREVDARTGLLALAVELPRLTGRAIPIEPERRPEDQDARDALLQRAALDPVRRELRRERRLSVALAALRRVHELIDAGHGGAVVQLWGLWGVLAPLVDANGIPDYGPHDHARRLDALALGCAPRTSRQQWRELAARRRVVHDLSRRLPRRTLHVWDGAQRRMVDTGEEVGAAPRVVHTLTTGEHPIAVDVSAAAWGRELLAPLWPQARTPPADLARALALGWAPADLRAGWEAIGTKVVRESLVRAWAGELLERAAATWRGEGWES